MTQPMSEDIFWNLIEENLRVSVDPDERIRALRASLSGLGLEEVKAFHFRFTILIRRAYMWDLWGAAYVAQGGCSDDGFEYFCRWLISRGREVYQSALKDPESLADLEVEPAGPYGVWEFEEFSCAAYDVWAELGGEGHLADFAIPGNDAGGGDPEGEPFDDSEEGLQTRYPKLWARFGEEPLDG